MIGASHCTLAYMDLLTCWVGLLKPLPPKWCTQSRFTSMAWILYARHSTQDPWIATVHRYMAMDII
jgi:hypothetical protein